MINLFLANFLINTCIFISGHYFKKVFEKKFKNPNYYDFWIYGIIIISFLSLIINFLYPLNKNLCSILMIISIILFLKNYLFSSNLKIILKYLLIISIISTLLIAYSNVNRPDAGLYHLPYISIINENKILIGSSNLHFRFGHISIIQYLSAFFNLHYFSTSSIAIPLASILAFFTYYNFKKIFYFLKEKRLYCVTVSFFIFLFTIYSFNRYSGFGNDMPSHIYYFVLTLYLLEIKNLKFINDELFFKVSLIIIFLFSIKTFMVITLILPIMLFLLSDSKKKIIKSYKLFLLLFFFLSIILKNILVSGCMIYPIKITCIKNLAYYDAKTTQTVAIESEAWSKGWSDQETSNKLDFKDYNRNFNWITSWSKKHLKIIIEKIYPIFLAYIIILCLLNYKRNKNKFELNHLEKYHLIFYLFLFKAFLLTLWFLKFPIYRYGSSIIAVFFILLLTLLFRNINHFNLKIYKNIISAFIIIFVFAALSKNFIRIKDDYDAEYFDNPWPKIYSFGNENKPQTFDKILNEYNDLTYYYSNGKMCMYSPSPCTSYKKDNITFKKMFNYKIYRN
jgi:hypothetical protein